MPKNAEPDSSQELRDIIRRIIGDSGMTEAKASRKLGFSAPSQLHRRLNDGKPPFSREEIERICKLFKLSEEQRIELLRLRGDVVIEQPGTAPRLIDVDELEQTLRDIIDRSAQSVKDILDERLKAELSALPALIADVVRGTIPEEILRERLLQVPHIQVGDIDGTGIAVGTNASATVVKLGSIQIVLTPQHDRIDPQETLAGLLDDAVPPHGHVLAIPGLPYHVNLHFVGRDADMRAIAKALHHPRARVVIHALGGQGKTQLASEFAHRYGCCFLGGVFWINASSRDSIIDTIITIGKNVSPSLWKEDDILTNDQKVQRVKGMWSETVPRLLVFDNCESAESLRHFLPTTGGCRTLITSRSNQWRGAFVNLSHELTGLDRSDSIKLLCFENLSVSINDPALYDIARELGNLPLALVLAGRFLSNYDMPPHEYLQALRLAQRVAHESLMGTRLREELPTFHEISVYATFELSYHKLKSNDDAFVDQRARAILLAMAQLAPGISIPDAVIQLATIPHRHTDTVTLTSEDVDHKSPVGEVEDMLDVKDAQIRLAQLGLVQRHNANSLLHQLIADFVRLQNEANEPEVRTQVEAALVDVLNGENPYEILGRAQCVAHLEALSYPPASFPDEEARMNWVHIMRNLGNILNESGQYAAAIEVCNRCLPVARSLSDKSLLARILHNLGNNHLLRYDGECEEPYKEARTINQQLVEQGGKEADKARGRTLDLDIAMSAAEARAGKVDSELHRLEDLRSNPVAIAEKRITDILANLAMFAADDGRVDAAVEYAKLGLAQRQLDDDYESLTLCGVVLSDAARRAGQMTDAIAFAEAAVADAQKTYQPLSMLMAERALGDAFLASNDVDAATTYIEQAADRLPANQEDARYDRIVIGAAQARLAAAKSDPASARQLALDTIERARPLFLHAITREMESLLATLEG